MLAFVCHYIFVRSFAERENSAKGVTLYFR